MTRKIILAICLMFIFVGLWACVGDVDYPASEEDTQTQDDFLHEFLQEGSNWIFFHRICEDRNSERGYIIFDNDGNEIFVVRDFRKEPEFTLLNDNLLRLDSSGGSNLRHTQFYSFSPARASAVFSNVLAVDHGLVVYLAISGHEEHSERIFTVVVHDIFDPRYSHISFQRDFGAYGFGPPFTAPVEFIDENTLFIAYVNSQGERVEEVLVLR